MWTACRETVQSEKTTVNAENATKYGKLAQILKLGQIYKTLPLPENTIKYVLVAFSPNNSRRTNIHCKCVGSIVSEGVFLISVC